jgi:hypothetical protein
MTHFLAATKRVFNVEGAWHSPNVVGIHNGSRSRFQNCALMCNYELPRLFNLVPGDWFDAFKLYG